MLTTLFTMVNKAKGATASAPNFEYLHLLTVLASTRSFTQAAQREGISKASMSMRIAELERSAGVALVRRTTRSVTLTAAGQELVAGTHAAFERIADSFANVRDLASEPRGFIRVTAPVALGRQYVAPLLPEFLAAHRLVRVELDLSDRLVNLAQEGFDLAIRHTAAPPETHVAWTLCESRSWLVASPAYLQAHGTPVHPSDLAQHDCVLYPRSARQESWAFERGTGRKSEQVTVQVQGPLRANNSEVLRDAVLAGLGIGLLPDFSVAGHLAPKQLVPVLPHWRPLNVFADRIHAIRPWSAHVPKAVAALVAHLRLKFAGGFAPTETVSSSRSTRRPPPRPAGRSPASPR